MALTNLVQMARLFLVFLGTAGKFCVHSSGSVVMCSAQMSAVGSVLSLLDLVMLSGPLIYVRLGAVASSGSLVLGYMDLMGGGPNSFQWSRPYVKATSVAPVFQIFSNILLKEGWGPAIAAVMWGSPASSLTS